MSQGLNKVMLFGHCGADAELRFTQAGQAVLNFRLAINETWLGKDGQKQERVEWVTCTCWGKRGEALAQYLKKGQAAFVEGSLRTSSYDDRDGVKRYKTEVVCSNVILAGSRGGGGDRDDGQPREQRATGGKQAPAAGGAVAPDKDLDGQYGNPEVKFVPRNWEGDDFKGKRFSECTAEFLTVLAESLQWSADNPKEGKEKFAEYNRKDAARARGWAARLRDGGAPGRRGVGGLGGAGDDVGTGDYDGDYGGADKFSDDSDIPF